MTGSRWKHGSRMKHGLGRGLAAGVLRLLADRRGSAITWIAVSIVPLLLAFGAAADIARGYLFRSELSSALDAAALAGGRVFNSPTRDEDIQRFFDANFPAGFLGATLSPLEITVTSEPGKPDRLTVSASGTVPTLFMKLAGIDSFSVAASAEITRANTGLQLVMVLDTTGSMASGGKIDAVRQASQDLVDILFGEQTTNDKIQIAVVPYSQAVNVGDLGDEFIDWSNIPPEIRSEGNDNRRWAGCVQARSTPGVLSDDPTVLEPDAYDANLAPVEVGGKWKPYIYPHWYDNKYNQLPFPLPEQNPLDPGHPAPSPLPGVEDEQAYRAGKGPNGEIWSLPSGNRGPNRNCPARLLPFTSDKTVLKNYLSSALVPRGWTIGNQGLVWGWRVLDPNPPFPNDIPWDDPLNVKALVLMTDGVNEVGSDAYTAYGRLPWGRLGVDNPDDAVVEFNKRIAKICHAMKQGGVRGRDRVEVYTVIFGSVATSTSQQAADLRQLYHDCASRDANFFLAPSNEELRTAFQTIANDLANLHLSR
ncbi:MAG: hypothetical protein KatS3mg119_1661 [Rhodothalassiaceae bacterium]|nr:MAG: hypothetical protein KatS3mg119_1661 [Rhodothalassiaceae bacterium]